MAKNKKPTGNEKTKEHSPQSRYAILLEIENTALKGRQLLQGVLKKVLGEKGVELDLATFSRYCLDVPIGDFLPHILKAVSKTRLSEEKLLAEITESLKTVLCSSNVKIEPGFKELMKAAGERNVLVGGLSTLDQEATLKVFNNAGVPEMTAHVLQDYQAEMTCQSRNPWLKLARKMSLSTSQCLAVTTSATSTKAAISAKMKCIAIPDKFTAFQDFGGADLVLDALDSAAMKTIFDMLSTPTSN